MICPVCDGPCRPGRVYCSKACAAAARPAVAARRFDLGKMDRLAEWRTLAVCTDPLLHLGRPGETRGERRTREVAAKQVCGGCPVRLDCLADALDADEQTGVWGGMNPLERAGVRHGLRPDPTVPHRWRRSAG